METGYTVDSTGVETVNSQGRHWVLTINNPTDADRASFVCHQNLFEYYVVGSEVGANGTDHLQCYIVFTKKVKFAAVKKIFPRCWCSIKSKYAKPNQAADYCKKDGEFTEFGTLPLGQGEAGGNARKEQWSEAKALAVAGKLDEIEPELFIRYYGTLKKISSDTKNKEMPATLDYADRDTPNLWYYGPTGTGKSRKAREENPDAYLKMNNKWWEAYDGEATVLIEDVGKTHEWMGDFLKIWADRYGFRGEVKQDSRVMRPKKIVVTSNYHPKDLWPDESIWGPLLRRFKIVEFTGVTANGQFTPPHKRSTKRPRYERENAANCLLCYLDPCECKEPKDTVTESGEGSEIEILDL